MTMFTSKILFHVLVLLALYSLECTLSFVLPQTQTPGPQRHGRHDRDLPRLRVSIQMHELDEEEDLSVLNFQQADALDQLLSSFPSTTTTTQQDLSQSPLSPPQVEALLRLLSSFPARREEELVDHGHDDDDDEMDFIIEEEIGDDNNDNNDNSHDMLSSKQAEALRLIKAGHNVFITGVAGTGKSLVLQRAMDHFRDLYNDDWEGQQHSSNNNKFVAVAPTGPTALALGGQTIHSFAGVGIPKTQDNFRKTRTNKENAKRWTDLEVLFLDECSMVSGEFLDRLSTEVSLLRKDERPFGGIQLIFCGDFLQLPPIPPRASDIADMKAAMQEKGQEPEALFLNRGFAFQSRTWRDAQFSAVELDVVYRQKNKEYVNVLMDIRKGQVTPEVVQFLKKCDRPLPPNEFGIRPTILHSRNKDVSRENLQELQQLDGESCVYEAMDSVEPEKGSGPWVSKQLEKNGFFKSCIAESSLQLRVGAQVLLVKGFPGTKLVNGSRGKVVAFRKAKGQTLNDMDEFPVVQFLNGITRTMTPQKFDSRLVGLGTCTRVTIPLKLAWAVTTHKAQGLTLDYVVADVGGVFGEAQAYVALSRATDEGGLELRNFSPGRVRANPVALDFYTNPNKSYVAWDGSTTTSTTTSPQPKQPHYSTPTNSPGGESPERLEKCKVPELKSMLRARGMAVSGRKSELIQRLCAPAVYD